MRTPAEIIKDIAKTYSALSPESLYCDGEISNYVGNRKVPRLIRKMGKLFEEFGRPVEELEAYKMDREFDNQARAARLQNATVFPAFERLIRIEAKLPKPPPQQGGPVSAPGSRHF